MNDLLLPIPDAAEVLVELILSLRLLYELPLHVVVLCRKGFDLHVALTQLLGKPSIVLEHRCDLLVRDRWRGVA